MASVGYSTRTRLPEVSKPSTSRPVSSSSRTGAPVGHGQYGAAAHRPGTGRHHGYIPFQGKSSEIGLREGMGEDLLPRLVQYNQPGLCNSGQGTAAQETKIQDQLSGGGVGEQLVLLIRTEPVEDAPLVPGAVNHQNPLVRHPGGHRVPRPGIPAEQGCQTPVVNRHTALIPLSLRHHGQGAVVVCVGKGYAALRFQDLGDAVGPHGDQIRLSHVVEDA